MKSLLNKNSTDLWWHFESMDVILLSDCWIGRDFSMGIHLEEANGFDAAHWHLHLRPISMFTYRCLLYQRQTIKKCYGLDESGHTHNAHWHLNFDRILFEKKKTINTPRDIWTCDPDQSMAKLIIEFGSNRFGRVQISAHKLRINYLFIKKCNLDASAKIATERTGHRRATGDKNWRWMRWI